MGRPLRMAPGEFVYHVLNRANGQLPLCEDACPRPTKKELVRNGS